MYISVLECEWERSKSAIYLAHDGAVCVYSLLQKCVNAMEIIFSEGPATSRGAPPDSQM